MPVVSNRHAGVVDAAVGAVCDHLASRAVEVLAQLPSAPCVKVPSSLMVKDAAFVPSNFSVRVSVFPHGSGKGQGGHKVYRLIAVHHLGREGNAPGRGRDGAGRGSRGLGRVMMTPLAPEVPETV